MKRKYILIFSMILLVALVSFTVFSTVHHGAHCSDIRCEVCAQIQSIKKVIQGLFISLSAFAGIIALISAEVSIFANEHFSAYITPITLKDKLSN